MTIIKRRSFVHLAAAAISSNTFTNALSASPFTASVHALLSGVGDGCTPSQESAAQLAQIIKIASRSSIARYSWPDRGVSPAGYISGVAVVYGRVYCKLKSGDRVAIEMAAANSGNTAKDALAWYSEQFRNLGMDNSIGGVDTLRHLFVLLTGLGMRESSGRYCAGRDNSASNMNAETAEAGLFQTSYNARTESPLLPELIKQYTGVTNCVEVFKKGISCDDADLENFGYGNGREFQRLSKACPAFAVEFAALALRKVRTHWGPINDRAAEVRPECDQMLQQVQQIIDG
jgi:hypothetical protein